jgi:hypothetical protein
MIAIVATSIILGGALGVRYSILVILPAIALALLVIALGGIARHEALATITLAMATSGVALQLGDLAGCFGRFLLRPLRRPPNQLTASLPRSPAGPAAIVSNIIFLRPSSRSSRI